MDVDHRPTPRLLAGGRDLSALEDEVDRLAALALAAQALADRSRARPEHERTTGWQERAAHLQWAVAAAQARLRDLAG